MRKPSRAVAKTDSYNLDAMMKCLASSLVSDFQTQLVDPCFCTDLQSAMRHGDVSMIRSAVPTLDYRAADSYKFKCDYQLASLFKRYRFDNDLMSAVELEDAANAKFLNVQTHLQNQAQHIYSADTVELLGVAKEIIQWVLGDFDHDEHRDLCRFGKRASVGVPFHSACEGARWQLPISGSPGQIAWFSDYISEDTAAQQYIAQQHEMYTANNKTVDTYQVVNRLTLTHVPKTYKSLRTIMPDTTIGSFISRGVGSMIMRRLKSVGYDISKLQERHKSLALEASIHNQWVTLDLSSASDTISVSLVKQLLPEDWFQFMTDTRIPWVTVPGVSSVKTETFSTMGIGYTFPLQTLIFLSLLQAAQYLWWPKRRGHTTKVVSVYGDDMIFHRRMLDKVLPVFVELGLIVNIDKSYYDGPFRESCGGDYHLGLDVRPFQPQNDRVLVSDKEYEATLYKAINGLLRRWTEWEVERALQYLKNEVMRVAGKVKLVPFDFPDDSGVKCKRRSGFNFLLPHEVAAVKNVGHGIVRFPFLSLKTDKKEELRHEPYYWLALRGLLLDDFNFSGESPPQFSSRVQDIIHNAVNLKEDVGALNLVSYRARTRDENPYRDNHHFKTQSKRAGFVGPYGLFFSTVVGTPMKPRYMRQSGTTSRWMP